MLELIDPTTALLTAIREARFSHGLCCPRCGSTACIRWGSFRQRVRYRCRGCGRTFNDLTGTPIARSKRLGCWSEYIAGMARCETVRSSARRAGVHPTTAFRWRHLTLAGLSAEDREVLRGWVELGGLWLPHSEKGRRPADRPPRKRGLDPTRARTDEGVNVLVACDRSGNTVATLTGRAHARRFTASDVECALRGRLEEGCTLLAAEGWLGGPALFADRAGFGFIDTRNRRRSAFPPLAHVRATFRHELRLLQWLRPFRGVATRYLPNYLIWHRVLDRQRRMAFPSVALQWPLDSRGLAGRRSIDERTTPTNTLREQKQKAPQTGVGGSSHATAPASPSLSHPDMGVRPWRPDRGRQAPFPAP